MEESEIIKLTVLEKGKKKKKRSEKNYFLCLLRLTFSYYLFFKKMCKALKRDVRDAVSNDVHMQIL